MNLSDILVRTDKRHGLSQKHKEVSIAVAYVKTSGMTLLAQAVSPVSRRGKPTWHRRQKDESKKERSLFAELFDRERERGPNEQRFYPDFERTIDLLV